MKLLVAREMSGKTQKQVAKESSITERTYQYYEAGKMEPGVRTAIRIAKALNRKTGEMETLFGVDASNLYKKDTTGEGQKANTE